MTVLYDYWRSSAAYRVRIALNLLGIAYEAVPVDLIDASHRAPEHMARNPQGLVPVLDIDGLRLTQSVAIVEYLDETRDAGFLPADAPGRARVRSLTYAIAMEMHPVCNLSVAKFATESSGGNLVMKDWMHAFLPPRMAAVETLLAGGPTGRFAHGDAPGLADICLVPQVYNLRRWEVDMAPFPRVSAIVAAMEALPAVAAAHPDRVRPG